MTRPSRNGSPSPIRGSASQQAGRWPPRSKWASAPARIPTTSLPSHYPRPLRAPPAEAIAQIFTEVVVAPDADDDAKAIFARKKNLRLLLTGELPDPARGGTSLALIAGGLLVQDRDNGTITRDQLKCVTKRQPTEQEICDCLFAWTVAKHVKSNAIGYARDGATAGIGAGQMNRRDSARIAPAKALEAAETHRRAQPPPTGSAPP